MKNFLKAGAPLWIILVVGVLMAVAGDPWKEQMDGQLGKSIERTIEESVTEATGDLEPGIAEVSEDTSPTLGGSLDAAGNTITSVGSISFSAGAYHQTNAASYKSVTVGGHTNKVTGVYRLDSENDIWLGGNAVQYPLARVNDWWGFGQNVANVGTTMGRSMGWRHVSTITGNTTIGNTDNGIVYRLEADSAGPFTLTLPNATQNEGKIIVATKIDAGTNAVIVAGTVDDAANQRLTSPQQGMIVASDGAQWRSIVPRVHYPKRAIIDGSEWIVTTGNALLYFNVTTYWRNGFWAQNAAASNDSKYAFIELKAGTYDVNELGGTGQGRGIVTVDIIDERGATNNTWQTDWYNNGDQVNVKRVQTNVFIPNDGVYKMQKRVLSRNPSANDWFEALVETRWERKGE